MSINVKGVFLPSKYVIPHMMERKSGSIINMSSCIAEIGLARQGFLRSNQRRCPRIDQIHAGGLCRL